MCTKTICATCKKPTWSGCGKHVEEALRDVPLAARCACPRPEPTPKR